MSPKLPGADIRCDVRRGLPFDRDSVDAITTIHLMQDLSWERFFSIPCLPSPIASCRRRASCASVPPDLDKAIGAYLASDPRYFCVPDEHARSIGAKRVTQIVWYGPVRAPRNFAFRGEWLLRAAFVEVRSRAFSDSAWPGLAALGTRERESAYVEAKKPEPAHVRGAARARTS